MRQQDGKYTRMLHIEDNVSIYVLKSRRGHRKRYNETEAISEWIIARNLQQIDERKKSTETTELCVLLIVIMSIAS